MGKKEEGKSLFPKNIYKILETGSSDIPGLGIEINETKYGGHIIKYFRKGEK